LLVSSSQEDRIRGIVRLGAIGTPEAIDALTGALEQSTIISRDGRARLEAIRVLAPHATRENVRSLLIRELSEVAQFDKPDLAPAAIAQCEARFVRADGLD
jgi:hypothetical protein